MERGTLVHAALAAFWREVGSHAAFAALDPESLDARITAAARAATKAVRPERWRVLSPLVEAGEVARLAGLVAIWLNVHERGRPPFAVANVETALFLDLRGLRLRLRLDRIDALDDGGTVIIDYKTGRASAADTWFERRPQAPQLGLYLLARRAAAPGERIRAIVYAQLKPGETRTRGLAADDGAWPKLGGVDDLKHAGLADWEAVEARFEDLLGALAAEVVAGHAAVAPRDVRVTCRNCGIQPLCRIGAIATDDGSEDGGDGDE